MRRPLSSSPPGPPRASASRLAALPIALPLFVGLGVLLPCGGCTPEAPMEVNELTWYLYREFANPDPLVMQRGLRTLEETLVAKGIGPDGEGMDRMLELQPLRREDLTISPYPSHRDPAELLGIGVMRESPWPVVDHARIQVDPDQLPVEPTAEEYTRTFIDPTDPACFVDRSCKKMQVSNEILRSNAVLSVRFQLTKDYTWFDAGDGREHMVGRSWAPMESIGEKGAIRQSYTLDAWLARPNGVTWRYQAVFSENDIAIATTDEIEIAVVKGAMDEAFKTADRVIRTRYHGGM